MAAAGEAMAATMTVSNAIGGIVSGGDFVVGSTGTVQPANNWPSGEAPSNAVDGNPLTKYLNFNQTNTGFIVSTDTSANLALDGLTFYTANDAPGRDPTSYQVYGSLVGLTNGLSGFRYSLASMTLLASGTLSLPDARNAGPESPVTFANSTVYASYLVVFPTVKSGSYTSENNSMQIAEIGFSGSVVPEPGAVVLVVAGGMVVAGRRRRG